MHSKDKLAAALRKVGLADMAGKAAEGYYHDFLSPLPTPELQLVEDLSQAMKQHPVQAPGINALRAGVIAGEFDATKGESEEWAMSPEGQAVLERLAGNFPHRPELGDAPVEPAYAEQMKAVARAVDEHFNGPRQEGKEREVGFVLMVFKFGEGGANGRCNYMSNARREQVLTLLKEQVARFEGRVADPETRQ